MTVARSLTGRLIRGLGIAIAVSWLLAAIVSGAILHDELGEASDVALRKTGENLGAFAAAALEPGAAVALPRPGLMSYDDEIVAFQLRDADGTLLIRNDESPKTPFAVPLRRGFRDADGFRVYTVPVEGGFLHVGDPLAHRMEGTVEATLGLLGPFVLLLPAMLGAVWWITRRSLAPIEALRDEISRRGGEDLTPVPEAALPRELAPIVTALNRLLGRLRRTLDAERGFASNAAHELRTPVAGALAEAQLLAAELPEESLRVRIARIERSLKRVARLSEKLLDLARAEAVAARIDSRSDLIPALRLVIDEFGDAPVDLEPARPSLEGRIDPDAFAIVARNLIENALRHGSGRERVRVVAEGASLAVINGGDALAAGTLDEIRGRFARGTGASAGSGLGLSIADTIARRAGMALTLRSPAPGRPDGFEARLELGA